MNVLIAGCGYVGSQLAQMLVAAGDRAWALKRSPAGLPDGVECIAADLTKPETLTALPTEIDTFVYSVSAGERTEAAYTRAYVGGLSNLLTALRGRAIRRGVFVSSTAVYGQDDGSIVHETSATEPTSFTGEILLRAEALLRVAPFDSTVLRLAGIYGPGRTWLVRRVHEGVARTAEPNVPRRYGNRIHRDDCAGAILHTLRRGSVDPVLVGVDDDPADLDEVYRFVAERLGVEPPPPGRSDAGRGGNKRASNRRLRESGYSILYPSYRDGYPAIIDAYLASR